MGHYSSFVVKIWVGEDGRMVRGYVQHVGTQEVAHFADTSKMLAFMEAHLEPANQLSLDQSSDWLATYSRHGESNNE